MTPIIFPESYQRPLGAGNNPNTGDLPRVVCIDPNTPGVCLSVSCWAPTDEELNEIIKTRKVYVAIMASLKMPTQPPIAVIGMNPISNGWYKPVPEEDLKHLAG